MFNGLKAWWKDETTLYQAARNLRYKARCLFGEILFALKVKPCYSHGICGMTTCGYGKLSSNGYWQYPVPSEERKVRAELAEKGALD